MIEKSLLERNIKIAYVQAFISNLAFFLPVMVLFFNKIVDSVTLVALLFSIQAITTIILEVPTGAFADLYGRKNTLVFAGFLSVMAITLLAFSTSFYMLVAFSLIFAFKNTLASGTKEAILYDSLKQLKREKEYKKIIGVNHVLLKTGAVIGAVSGGFMAKSFIQLPFLLSIPISITGLILYILTTEPNYEKELSKSMFKQMHGSVKILISNKQLLFLSLFSLFSFGVAESSHHLSQIFYNFVNLPIAYFGIVAALGSLMGALGAFLSHRLAHKFGDKQVLITAKIFDGLMLILATVFLGYVGIVFMIIMGFFRNIGAPILAHLLNERIESKNRATILSLNSLMMNFG